MALSRREFLASAAALAVPRVALSDSPRVMIDMLAPGGLPSDPAPLVAAGVTAFVADLSFAPRNYVNALDAFAGFLPECRERGLQAVLRADDVAVAQRARKLGVVLACQDAQVLDANMASLNDQNLYNLVVFHGLGLRILQLTHNDRNALGDGYLEPGNVGLSLLGRRVVARMNELGVLVDLSHCGDRTTDDAIALSKKPCAITHTGCRALVASGRNKTDSTLRALAEKGGVVGIFNVSYWLTRQHVPRINHFVDHVRHAVKVAGIEHVAVGTDCDPAQQRGTQEQWLKGFGLFVQRNLGNPGCEWPAEHVHIPELTGPARMTRIADVLAAAGYKAADVDRIVGSNVVRLLRETIG